MDPAAAAAARRAAILAQLPPGCRLLAVSKGQSAEAMRALAVAGQRSFAESRLQEAAAKQEALADLAGLDWHFIGRLQANKARQVVRHFGTIHSLDSVELAQRLARIAAEEGLAPAVLFQVKLRPDPAKTGFDPDRLRQTGRRRDRLRLRRSALRPHGHRTTGPASGLAVGPVPAAGSGRPAGVPEARRVMVECQLERARR